MRDYYASGTVAFNAYTESQRLYQQALRENKGNKHLEQGTI